MIRGKTKIELEDVRTGGKEVIEKENMVTDALQHIFTPMGFIKTADTFYGSSFVNYYKTLTGGLLLLDRALPADAGTLFLPRGVKVTGSAAYDAQNTSGQVIRGSYNATESLMDPVNRIAKYVYDFDTAEGNGTVAAVALTHAGGAYTGQGTAEAPVRAAHPYFVNIGSGNLRLTGTGNGIGANDRTIYYNTYGAGCRWIFLVDAGKDCAWYFTVESATSVVVRAYRANISTVSLFDMPSTGRVLLSEETVTLQTEISQRFFAYNYEEESQKLYIISAGDYDISKNEAFVITEIDIAGGYAVKQYPMTNQTGVEIRLAYDRCNSLCYEGYVYLMSYHSPRGIYREEIGNPANVQKLETGIEIRESYPMLAREGRVYYEYASSYSGSVALYIIETDTFTLKIPESNLLYNDFDHQYVPVLGVPMTYYLSAGSNNATFAIRNDYLATINNLDTPVLKTAAKTMKVTYTLQEV